MPIEMKMPDLATTGSDVTISRWLVEPGQTVKRGDLLLEVETDKAAVEVESIASGVLHSVLFAPGDEVAAGQVIAIIGASGDAPVADSSPTVAEPSDVHASTPAGTPDTASGPPPRRGLFGRGRENAPASAMASTPLSLARRTAGRRMQESKQTIPHFYLEASFNAERMIARRNASTGKLAWDALFVYAAGRALSRFGEISSRLDGDSLTAYDGATIGVAVDINGELFVVPARFDAAPESISAQLLADVEKVKQGDADARKLTPSALTITNLGATKVERFYAIVNPPESAILAFGRVAPQAAVEGGSVVVQTRGQVTLSADHRVVNGKYAAQFLSAVVDELESL